MILLYFLEHNGFAVYFVAPRMCMVISTLQMPHIFGTTDVCTKHDRRALICMHYGCALLVGTTDVHYFVRKHCGCALSCKHYGYALYVSTTHVHYLVSTTHVHYLVSTTDVHYLVSTTDVHYL